MNNQQDPRVEAGLNDFLMLMLKAVVLKFTRTQGQEFIGLTQGEVMRAEECDLKFQRDRTGDLRFAVIPGAGEMSKIVVPNGQSPIQVFQSFQKEPPKQG